MSLISWSSFCIILILALCNKVQLMNLLQTLLIDEKPFVSKPFGVKSRNGAMLKAIYTKHRLEYRWWVIILFLFIRVCWSDEIIMPSFKINLNLLNKQTEASVLEANDHSQVYSSSSDSVWSSEYLENSCVLSKWGSGLTSLLQVGHFLSTIEYFQMQ